MGFREAWKNLKVIKEGVADLPAAFQQQSHMMLAALGPVRGAALPGSAPEALRSAGPEALEAGVRAIRAHDAAFDPVAFTTWADQIHQFVASAWLAGDSEAVRSVAVDALWGPMASLLARPGARSWGIFMGTTSATGQLVGAHSDPAYDSTLVRFDASAPALADEAPARNWTEEWLFQRSSRRPSGDGGPKVCPSCGTPAVADTDGVCRYCHQPIPVLTEGWLAARIESQDPFLARFGQGVGGPMGGGGHGVG